jgi:hypothetical protein
MLRHRVSWIAGYTFVGDGTNGAADNVFYQSAAGTYLSGSAATAGTRGAMPILGGDTQLGATYVSDVEKHYARKVIRAMRLHVVSMQTSTANNMMCVIAPSRGCGLAETQVCSPLATAANVQQLFTNVVSMDDAMEVASFESKTLDITKYIAGGGGARQNEFEISNNISATTVLVSGGSPAQDLDGIVPACLTVSGNSTTTTLRNTRVHAIIVEQDIDFLDFIGGNAPAVPVGVATPGMPSSSPAEEEEALRQRIVSLRAKRVALSAT